MSKPRGRTHHAQLHLPPLDAACALTLVNILHRASAAIWRAHGQQMIELLQQGDDASVQVPLAGRLDEEYVQDGNPNVPDDVPF